MIDMEMQTAGTTVGNIIHAAGIPRAMDTETARIILGMNQLGIIMILVIGIIIKTVVTVGMILEMIIVNDSHMVGLLTHQIMNTAEEGLHTKTGTFMMRMTEVAVPEMIGGGIAIQQETDLTIFSLLITQKQRKILCLQWKKARNH
jgi:hypothetical protein